LNNLFIKSFFVFVFLNQKTIKNRVTEDEITKYTTLPSRIVRSKLDQLRNDKLVYQLIFIGLFFSSFF